MPAFSLGPIASGLPKDIVERLMEVERRPLQNLQRRKANEENRLKLVQDLITRLNDAQASFREVNRFKKFRELGSIVGRPETMDVFVDNEVAQPAEYSIEVKQLAGRSSMLSNGFEDPNDTQIGVGYFSYDLPSGETREVFIGEEENTLHEIASKINSQRDLKLQALVVNDGVDEDAPWRLLITHDKSGEVNDAEFPAFYFVDGDRDFYVDKERPAQNSVVKLNGFDLEFAGTQIQTAIPGVTMELKEALPGQEFTLKIFEDREKVEGKVKAIVEKINEILMFIQEQNSLDENSRTSETLGGDITLQNLEGLLRKMIFRTFPTEDGGMRFSDLGVRFQRNGLLEIDSNKLKSTVLNRFNAVGEYFAGIRDNGQGFIGTMEGSIKSYVNPGGIVQSRKSGIEGRIRDIDRQIDSTERRLARTQENLQQKFAALESTMARLKAQQAQVSGALGTKGILDTINIG